MIKTHRLSLIFFLLLYLIALTGCSHSEASDNDVEKAKSKSAPVAVKVAAVEKGSFQREIISNGLVTPQQKATLSFERGGILQSLRVKNGSAVQKGDTLAVLNKSQVLLEKKKIDIQIEKAYVELLDLLITQQYNKLSDTAFLSHEKRTNLMIKSGLLDARSRMQESNLRLQQCVITAPFSGKVADVEVMEHNRISVGKELCILINDKHWLTDFYLMESELQWVHNGQIVEIIPFEDNSTVYPATVYTINPMVDKNGLVKVQALLHNGSSKLVNGRHVKVKVIIKVPNQIIVPKEALVLRSNREVVFLYKKGLAKWVYVDVMEENESKLSVKGKLHRGDEVIITNNMNLSHDAEVELK